MATRAANAEAGRPNVKFDFTLLPEAFLGIFGLRTESELPYESLLEDGAFSVRHYLQHAEIRNEEVGTREEAVDRSFNRLFSYIQGQNWDERKFSMTTPVLQRRTGDSRWSTSFYLKGDAEELPLPRSSSVKLYSVTPETMAVMRFTGRMTEESAALHVEMLKKWIRERDLKIIGEAEYAQFDQPFSIPFLRRNEVRIPIERLA